jgi:hypothetical protein
MAPTDKTPGLQIQPIGASLLAPKLPAEWAAGGRFEVDKGGLYAKNCCIRPDQFGSFAEATINRGQHR